MKTAIRSSHIVTTFGVIEGVILFDEDQILAIDSYENLAGELKSGWDLWDAGDLVVMPGIVDTHVHINEPGRTDWEGFATATQAAIAGGLTTVVDMPLNCLPVTTSQEALASKLRAVKDKLWCDCAFWGGVIPDSLVDLSQLLESGVVGVKSFMIDSGIPEFPEMNPDQLRQAMGELKKAGLPYLLHAEMDNGDGHDIVVERHFMDFVNSRPRSWENLAIETVIGLVRETGCHAHIVHLSSSDALGMIRNAKAEGLPLTVETCPHYLCLTAEEVQEGNTAYKCCPPIREEENRKKLWLAVLDGTIDFVVSDHSPCTAGLKLLDLGDFDRAWGGIASLQYSLPLVWNEGAGRGLTIEKLAEILCQKTAEFIGMSDSRGELTPGRRADICVWNPDDYTIVAKENMLFKNKVTPYEGRKLRGKVERVYLSGKLAVEGGVPLPKAQGQPVLRN